MKTAAVNAASSTVTTMPGMTGLAAGWTEIKLIGVRSTDSNTLTNFQVLVELTPGNFNYAAANADGSDLRFGSTSSPTFDLSYFIESWNPGGTSRLWVKLPTIAPNNCTNIFLFYGNPMATTTTSDFAATFPNAFVSTGAMGGDTLTGNQTFDWFEVKAGHTLNIGAGQILSVTARNVIIAGTVDGVGTGSQAPAINTNGTGPGGGSTSTNAGSGGGSYAGVGGTGGFDSGDTPGTGGPTYGTQTGTDVAMGSSGGSGTGLSLGGNGGGAFSLTAQEINISGTVSVTGGVVISDGTGRGGGGGSGGGILVSGYNVVLSGTFNASGSNGATGTSTANDSGGGGGGGRIKFFGENTLTNTATTNVNGGVGGPNGTAAPGQPGGAGTTHAVSGIAAFDYPQVTASASDNCCSPSTATVSGTTTICAGGMASVTVMVTGGVAPYTVTLNNGGGTLTGASPLIFMVSPGADTTYAVASATDAMGCPVTASGSATVTVKPTPVVNPVTPAAICSGTATNIALTGTAGATFSWTIGPVTGSVSGQSASSGTSIAQTLIGSGSVTYIVTPTLNDCSGAPVNIVQTVNALPTISNPSDQIVLAGGTATFSVTASTPTVQWYVSTDNGGSFAPLAGQTSTTLTLPNVTASMNGNLYRAVADNGCLPATSQAARLTVNQFKVDVGDPLVCLTTNGLVGVTATITNNNAAQVTANFTATLPTNLNGLPGTGLATSNPGGIVVTAGSVTWMGTIPANTTVTLTYKAQLVGAPGNAPLCVDSTVSFNNGPLMRIQACATLNCPTNPVNVAVSDQKAGSLLVFPYYTSKLATQSDTRLTVSNIGEATTTVHLFFIDGATCQQADSFLCLTPNASFSFKASEYDAEATGWLLAVAVDKQGRPIQYNGLIGNAFVKDGEYVDNYGAEAFRANSPLVATINGETATLFLDNQSYDAVPNQFAIEIQSPVDAAGQKVVTVGLSGDLTTGRVTGAGQVGTAQIINGNEKPFGSFNGWLAGNCQASSLISTTSPRVPNGMAGMIPTGQVGTIKLNIGAGVGLLMTPRTTTWKGLRLLHKTSQTATTLTIPIVVPVC